MTCRVPHPSALLGEWFLRFASAIRTLIRPTYTLSFLTIIPVRISTNIERLANVLA